MRYRQGSFMDSCNRDLVQRAKHGDSEAFGQLIRIYERVAMAVAYGILEDATAAGDVSQSAFLRAWQRLGDLRESNRFGPWLCGIVRNLAIDQRRRRPAPAPLCDDQPIIQQDRWLSDPSDEVCRREDHQIITAAISLLDELSRITVVLRYYQDLSSRQIAALLKTTPEAIDMRLSRARGRLRALLATI